MDRLKELLLSTNVENVATVKDKVEVVGLTIASCLNRASEFLKTDLSNMDYEIIERGKKSFLNMNPKPYRILAMVLSSKDRFSDLEEFSKKMGVGERLLSDELDRYDPAKDRDGRVLVRNYRSGVFITVQPPTGDGKPADLNEAELRIQQMGIQSFDQDAVQRAVNESIGEPIKIGNYSPRPENDSTVKVDISPDEMKAYVRITPPRPGGRHLEVQDVINALKTYGVLIGFQEDEIRRALENDRYMQDVLAAKGIPPKHGEDARIDYKVNVNKDSLNFKEDASGRVDYKNLNMVENVVVGQILAEKIPLQHGRPGRTLKNRIVEARDGKDTDLRPGKNTILSDDGTKLIAEINGQVVYANSKLNVEPVYRVTGDVGPKTGNIMFLGSVSITGNVLDNFEVKAAGNVEINGSVQKAKVEAEGDIIVHSGIVGRDEAHIESTGGSVVAKFIQSATVQVTGDVTVQEGILHSNVESGGRILCNGRRAQIVGGHIRAKRFVRARMIGSQAYTATEITAGIDPRILSQLEELQKMKGEAEDRLKKAEKSIKTLHARKAADPEAFAEEQNSILQEHEKTAEQMKSRIQELDEEIARLNEHMDELGEEGKVHAEKDLFPGVVVTIKDAVQNISDTYHQVTLSYDQGYIKIGKFEKDEEKTGRRR